ncbi:hypothetical protein C1H46_008719 [Malus baccata]|uniref:Uncharacterized protein n=1 Tax=Malus baccata TaxID=106549 RepID=A0A540N5C4_MALBA|nr:hypothetical protein C1H46_008719 [Malus baccata]
MAAGNLPPRIKVALTAVDRDGFRVDGEVGEWTTSKWVVQIQDGERVMLQPATSLRACDLPASLSSSNQENYQSGDRLRKARRGETDESYQTERSKLKLENLLRLSKTNDRFR